MSRAVAAIFYHMKKVKRITEKTTLTLLHYLTNFSGHLSSEVLQKIENKVLIIVTASQMSHYLTLLLFQMDILQHSSSSPDCLYS